MLVLTVWDGEIEGIKEAIRNLTEKPLLIPTDSQAAIKAIVKAGKRGRARTAALKEIIESVAERQTGQEGVDKPVTCRPQRERGGRQTGEGSLTRPTGGAAPPKRGYLLIFKLYA